ncbi:hypothetical protein ABPG74_006182 [Tetrahymena malaccensis]
MFKHLVLSILSSNSRKDLQILDLSFSNIGQDNSLLLQELSIVEFIQNKINELKSLNVRFYSGDPIQKFGTNKQKNSKPQQQQQQHYLNFFMQVNKFGVEEYLNQNLVRHLKLNFKGIKELKAFAKSKVDFSQILQFGNSKGTIQSISESLGERQQQSLSDGNNVDTIDLFHVILGNQLDEIWIVLINELFMSCRKSIRSIVCDISFQEGLQSYNLKNNDEFIKNKIINLKTQQRRPFEQMIINYLQPINYKQLKRVEVKNTIYDIMFNQLLLSSISVSKLDYFEVAQNIKIDKPNGQFMLKLTDQTQEFLNLMPDLTFSNIKLLISTQCQQFLRQIKTIIQKQSPDKVIKSIEIITDFDKIFESNSILELLNLIKDINSFKLTSKLLTLEISQQKIALKQPNIDYKILNFLNNYSRKQFCLFTDCKEIGDAQQTQILKNFKFLNVFISNQNDYLINNLKPMQQLINQRNLHKLVIYGIQNFSSQGLQNMKNLLRGADKQKIVDIFPLKKTKKNFNFFSETKIIKIIQLLKLIQKNSKIRQEIIMEAITQYLI